MHYKYTISSQKGFSLWELIIALSIIGMMTIMLGPVFQWYFTVRDSTYKEKQQYINQSITESYINYAKMSSALGTLPTPYTGGSYTNSVVQSTNTTLLNYLLQQNFPQTEIYHDGTGAQNARVYEQVTGLTQSAPLLVQNGPTVTLTYSMGVVYTSNCSINDSACISALKTSNAFSSGTYNTWTPNSSQTGAALVSNLLVQKSMLIDTANKIDKIREALLTFYKTMQLQNSPSATTNYFPNSDGTTGNNLASLGATVQGCWHAWIDLSNAGVAVLPTIGLTQAEHGTTAWGGKIEYCRDYDGSLLPAGANSVPHYGAIRVNKDVSSGLAPDTVTLTNNVVLTI